MSTFDCLAIAPSVKQKLIKAGFREICELRSIPPTQLAREVGISPAVAVEVLEAVNANEPSQTQGSQPNESMIPTQLSMGLTPSLSQQFSQTANDMLNRQREVPNIVTFSQALDKLLGGGVHPSCLTEFCGIPGIGKTQVGMQLALDVQIPKVFGGVGGSAIYIDTEGSFMITRIKQMAEGVLAHLQVRTHGRHSPRKTSQQLANATIQHRISTMSQFHEGLNLRG
eukprot:TRINITY_DN67617_c7_g1_i3.p1 TRINITY_DN67617_c7_g1~~TRINITY_DN67617_c7_g1_i3.p1  ORF type:complete len:226 (+),score=9.26 TRINITY_DN67617_c7_g1_i3:28-705(+)